MVLKEILDIERVKGYLDLIIKRNAEKHNLIGNVEEGPAFGAALIAGAGVGVYNNFAEAVNRIIKVKKTIAPRIKNTEKYNQYYRLYKKLYYSLKENFKEL